MDVLKGLAVTAGALVLGGLLLFAYASFAPGLVAAGGFIRLFSLAALLSGSLVTGWHSKRNHLTKGLDLALICWILLAAGGIWFAPELLSLAGLLKTLAVMAAAAVFGVLLGANLAALMRPKAG
ncbi:MAG: hypothetical protein FWD39_04745 [Clostridiales bacterium]|nr:hypothetical protein [Clostridiales bacterium]